MNDIQFPDHPAPGVSDRYIHIDTNQFIAAMEAEGFSVYDIKRDGARTHNPLYTRHMVRFRMDAPDVREDVRPHILFMNSHNRTARAKVALGLIRWACFNGVIAGDIKYRIAARHLGDPARDLIARTAALARNTTQLYSQIEQWEAKELSKSTAHDFARLAVELRWPGVAPERFTTDAVLEPRRAEDDGMSLWRVFNRVQENLTKGGLEGLAPSGRRVSTRPLNEVNTDVRFNTQLWNAAAALLEV